MNYAKILGVFVLATVLAVPAMVSAASQVPAGFIAVSKKQMTWDEANAWCQQHGGRLPLIGGSTSPRPEMPPGTPIDGFGSKEASWPKGLPRGTYWTGAKVSNFPNMFWAVDSLGGTVGIEGALKFDPLRVACVP